MLPELDAEILAPLIVLIGALLLCWLMVWAGKKGKK
jgi:hypothetical protein